MTATTIFLRFDDRAEALGALASFGLVADDPETGAPDFVTTAWLEEVRVDLALVGGDGAHRYSVGTAVVDLPDVGPVEMPVIETAPGFHVNLLWSDGTPPDFGAARISPETPSQVFAA